MNSLSKAAERPACVTMASPRRHRVLGRLLLRSREDLVAADAEPCTIKRRFAKHRATLKRVS